MAAFEISQEASCVEAEDASEIEKLDHVYAALTPLDPRHVGLAATETVRQFRLGQTGAFPSRAKGFAQLAVSPCEERLRHTPSSNSAERYSKTDYSRLLDRYSKRCPAIRR